MFHRFQRIALDVSYFWGNRSMFLIVVFLMKKACTGLRCFVAIEADKQHCLRIRTAASDI